MRVFGLLVFFLILGSLNSFAHPWKPRHYIIIDTDGGMDDFRALSMLLASPDVRVLGITVSPGVLPATEVYERVKSMLAMYYQQGIPVGINDAPEIVPANFPMAKSFSWGSDSVGNYHDEPKAVDVIKYIYSNCSDSIKYVCLGSLNVVNKAIDQVPVFISKTSAIIWSCSNFKKESCFNNSIDKEAFRRVSKTSIPLVIVDGKSSRADAFDKDFQEKIVKVPIVYAKEVERSLLQPHHIFYDEMVALWLHFPNYFLKEDADNLPLCQIKSSVSDSAISNAFTRILTGETVNQNQVINFSWRKSDYFEDVQPIFDEAIIKYGRDEWVAEVMANELHRHLGVFAIVGAKMGIRAKEYFGAGIDEMKVVSYAGGIPPFSCMNDGLQVSTGATLGHGLISVAADTIVRPVADFTYMGRTIRLTLKPVYGKKIASEVKELNGIYGLNSSIYWELIRKLAVKYWLNFDRHEIFIIEERR